MFRPTLSYVVLDRKDAGKFSSTFVASMGYTWRASRRLRLGATYNYQDRDITRPEAPDARIDTLSFDADFAATKDDILRLEVSPKVEDSTEFTAEGCRSCASGLATIIVASARQHLIFHPEGDQPCSESLRRFWFVPCFVR